MTPEIQTFLVDTLVWTAALIALVLILRRPVARLFGPQAAYALWLLPLLRVAFPPLVLPAIFAPVAEPQSQLSVTYFTAESAAVPTEIAATAPISISWPQLALAIWLGGAAVFLIVRFGFYFQMRDELLEDARPVGEAGRIRLVETPATKSPIAFGVLDKVVALPIGFMAAPGKAERDLALEHEFSHHAAHDLLANLLVQPLFSLHWFNPLGWYGWRAMRRDQEAACDARVIALRGADEKAVYASVIASFAAGPAASLPVSLAAPMACPVIGEKSIIHRLRSLTMSEISPRRRMAGKVLMGAALLALPLTASVTYAEGLTVPNPPPAPKIAPLPPAAPAAPGAAGMVPPTPPAPPSVLALQSAPEMVEDVEIVKDAERDESAAENVFIMRRVEEDKDGKKVHKEHKVIRHAGGDHKMSAEDREEMMKELREELANMDIEIDEALDEAQAVVLEMKGKDGDTRVETTCSGGQESGEWTADDGTRVVRICKSQIMASALAGLKEARKSIAAETDMPEDVRSEVLKALDEKIKNWKSKS